VSSNDESERGKELDSGNGTGVDTFGTTARALGGTVAGSTLASYSAISQKCFTT